MGDSAGEFTQGGFFDAAGSGVNEGRIDAFKGRVPPWQSSSGFNRNRIYVSCNEWCALKATTVGNPHFQGYWRGEALAVCEKLPLLFTKKPKFSRGC